MSSLPPSSTLPPLPDCESDSEHSVTSNNEPLRLVPVQHSTIGDVYKIDQLLRGRGNKVNINWNDSLDALKAIGELPEVSTGWIAYTHSQQTLKRLFPAIKKSKFDTDYKNYKLLFCFVEPDFGRKDNIIYLKGAVQHRVTGKIAMLSATNAQPRESHYPSQDDGWYVFKADMNAPACFWNAFKVC